MKRERQEIFSIRKSHRGAVSTCIAVLSFLALANATPEVKASEVAADATTELVAATEEVAVEEPAVETVAEEVVEPVVEAPQSSAEVTEIPDDFFEEETATEEFTVLRADAAVATEEKEPVSDASEAAVEDATTVVNYADEEPETTTADIKYGSVKVQYHAVDKDGNKLDDHLLDEKVILEDAEEGTSYDATDSDVRPDEITVTADDGRMLTYFFLGLYDSYHNSHLAIDGDDEIGVIEGDKTKIINYYYELATGSVLVRYEDVDGNLIDETYKKQDIPANSPNSSTFYRTSRYPYKPEKISSEDGLLYFLMADGQMSDGTSVINGIKQVDFELGEGPNKEYHTSKEEGWVEFGTTIVTYVYEKGGDVVVNYYGLDSDGNAVPLSGVTEGIDKTVVNATEIDTDYSKPGTEYDTNDLKPIKITDAEGNIWELLSERTDGDPEQGVIVSGVTKEVNYYYEQIKSNVLVNYYGVDDDGNVVGNIAQSAEDTVDAAQGTGYNTAEDLKPTTIVDENGEVWQLLSVRGTNPHAETDGDAEEGQTSVTVNEDGTLNDTKVVNYYYEKVKANVTVHYFAVDKNGNIISFEDGGELAPSREVLRDAEQGTAYDTTTEDIKPESIKKDYATYRRVDIKATNPHPATDGDVEQGIAVVTLDEDGNINDTLDINYYYEMVTGRKIARHIDIYGNDLIEPYEYEGYVGEVMFIDEMLILYSQKKIVLEDGRVFKPTSDPTSDPTPDPTPDPTSDPYIIELDLTPDFIHYSISEEGTEEYVYYYEEVKSSVNLVYGSKDDLFDTIVVVEDASVGSEYDVSDLLLETIVTEDGRLFKFVELEGDVKGLVTEEKQILYANYERATSGISVTYIDEDGNVLKSIDNAVVGNVGEPYDTSMNIVERFVTQDGRSFVYLDVSDKGDSKVGIIEDSEQEVFYLYAEVLGSVTVEHISDTGEVLIPTADVKRDASLNEEYSTTSQGVIQTEDGRVFTFSKLADDSAPETGQVTEETQHVIYVYAEILPTITTIYRQTENGAEQVEVTEFDGKTSEKVLETYTNTREVTDIPYTTERQEDADLEIGVEEVRQQGVNGQLITGTTYSVFDGSLETTPIEERIEPITEIIAVGTKELIVDTPEEVPTEVPYEEILPTITTIYRQTENGAEQVEVTEFDGKTSEKVLETYTNTREVTEIPYTTERQEDADLEIGVEEVRQQGVNGQLITGTTYSVFDGSLETTPIEERIEPITEIIAVGTKEIIVDTPEEIPTEAPEEEIYQIPDVAPEADALPEYELNPEDFQDVLAPDVTTPEEEEETPQPAPTVEEETLDYYNNLMAERQQLLQQLDNLDQLIAEAEELLAQQDREGSVLSDQVTILLNNLTQVQNRLKEVDSEISELNSQLDGVNKEIDSRQSELAELQKTSKQSQLLGEIDQLESEIATKESRIKEINQLLPQLKAELAELQDENALDQKIAQKETELKALDDELLKLQDDLEAKKKDRETYRLTQEKKIADLKAQLEKLGAKEKVTVHPAKEVLVNKDFRGKSDATWERYGKKHEQVRFTGDREIVIELTDEQAKEYEQTGSFTYTVNEDKVEEYFYQYLEEIRKNNGITVPITKSAEASDFARRRARENASYNDGEGRLTHDTNLSDKGRKYYENAGYLYLGKYSFIRSDQELAYELAWNWFSDYANVHGASGKDGGYGHRNNLLYGSAVKTAEGTPVAVVNGDGLGISEATKSEQWHYLQNGYDYTYGFGYTAVEFILDSQNNQSLRINGVTTPTVFMDALTFKYVLKGYTEVEVNQEVANLEQKIRNEEAALSRQLKAFDAEITALEDSKSELTTKRETTDQELRNLVLTKTNLAQKRQQLESQIKALDAEKTQLEGEVARLNQQLLAKKAELEADDENFQRQQELKKELAELTQKKSELTNQIQDKVRERSGLVLSQQDLEQDIELAQKELADHQAQRDEFAQNLEVTRRNRNELDFQIKVDEDKIDDVDNYETRNKLNDPEVSELIDEQEREEDITDPTPSPAPTEDDQPAPTEEEEISAIPDSAPEEDEKPEYIFNPEDFADVLPKEDDQPTPTEEEEISAVPDYAPEEDEKPEYIFNPEDFTDVLPKEDDQPSSPVITHQDNHKPIVKGKGDLGTGGAATAASEPATGSSTVTSAKVTSPERRTSSKATETSLPNTGDSASVVGFIGLAMLGLSAVSHKRRRH